MYITNKNGYEIHNNKKEAIKNLIVCGLLDICGLYGALSEPNFRWHKMNILYQINNHAHTHTVSHMWFTGTI